MHGAEELICWKACHADTPSRVRKGDAAPTASERGPLAWRFVGRDMVSGIGALMVGRIRVRVTEETAARTTGDYPFPFQAESARPARVQAARGPISVKKSRDSTEGVRGAAR